MNSGRRRESLWAPAVPLSPLPALAINGTNGVAHRVFTNPIIPLLGGANLFDEFAFMFNNTTANAVTVTLTAIGLGNSLTWDASGASPAMPTDGSGNWSTRPTPTGQAAQAAQSARATVFGPPAIARSLERTMALRARSPFPLTRREWSFPILLSMPPGVAAIISLVLP